MTTTKSFSTHQETQDLAHKEFTISPVALVSYNITLLFINCAIKKDITTIVNLTNAKLANSLVNSVSLNPQPAHPVLASGSTSTPSCWHVSLAHLTVNHVSMTTDVSNANRII